MEETFISKLAAKVGVNDQRVVRKAIELKILLSGKTVPSILNCSESCKAIVCLDLASKLLGDFDIDREECIKTTGCRKKIYVNIFNNISTLLNLDKIYSVRDLCLTCGVSEIHEKAENVLKQYLEVNNFENHDVKHPMFQCAAIYSVCRCQKVKVNKLFLQETSRLKKSEFETLCSKFQQLLCKIEENKKITTKQTVLDENISINDEELSKNKKAKTQESNSKRMSDEDYETWKRRMIED